MYSKQEPIDVKMKILALLQTVCYEYLYLFPLSLSLHLNQPVSQKYFPL